MKKFYCLIIITFTLGVLSAQNLPTIDYKLLHWGFYIGVNTLDYGIKHNEKSNYRAEIRNWTPGFTAGLIGDLRLNKYFNLRLVPALNLGFNQISFIEGDIKDNKFVPYLGNDSIQYKNYSITSSAIVLPLHIKYSSVRIKDYKPYIFAGGGVSFELNHDKKPENPILLNLMDYFIEFGVGCTIYTPYFRCSPEIKFAIGFNNKLVSSAQREGDSFPLENHLTDAICKLTSRVFTLVVNFE